MKDIILAPHVDDEVIGCFDALTQMNVKEVHYFFEVDDTRREEAFASAARFNFTPVFHQRLEHIPPTGGLVYLPHPSDLHPDHRAVHARYRSVFPTNRRRFYSIDMEFNRTLALQPAEKHEALLSLFPSQHKLFDDARYWLFERLFVTDVMVSTSSHYATYPVYEVGAACYVANETRLTVVDLCFKGQWEEAMDVLAFNAPGSSIKLHYKEFVYRLIYGRSYL